MGQFKSLIIEGVDRTGKNSLIDGILCKLGYFQTIHYQKPEILNHYLVEGRKVLNLPDDANTDDLIKYAQRQYQFWAFNDMFHMLSSGGRFILNRAHLGEYVYSPRYRKYDGSYVFDLEKKFINDHGSKFSETTLLILLHTSNFDNIKDDGQSFDFSQKEAEQMDFIRAFERSEITHKMMIDVVTDDGNYVPKHLILDSVITAMNDLPSMNHPIWHLSWSKYEDVYTRNSYFQPDPKKSIS